MNRSVFVQRTEGGRVKRSAGKMHSEAFHVTAAVFRSAAPQCRQVKITILGEEGVPVQVDGEAWIQPPGIVKIVHRNRAQMLTRDRVSSDTYVGNCCLTVCVRMSAVCTCL